METTTKQSTQSVSAAPQPVFPARIKVVTDRKPPLAKGLPERVTYACYQFSYEIKGNIPRRAVYKLMNGSGKSTIQRDYETALSQAY